MQIKRDGNVIDFRPRHIEAPIIEVQSEILYRDHIVCLMRFHLLFQGKVIATEHITAAT